VLRNTMLVAGFVVLVFLCWLNEQISAFYNFFFFCRESGGVV
jgi:hypothetical protein